jgi:hypothetical protein
VAKERGKRHSESGFQLTAEGESRDPLEVFAVVGDRAMRLRAPPAPAG